MGLIGAFLRHLVSERASERASTDLALARCSLAVVHDSQQTQRSLPIATVVPGLEQLPGTEKLIHCVPSLWTQEVCNI